MKELVTILGAGESGTGAAILARQKGFDVFVSDSGVIQDKYKAELKKEGIPFEEGKHTVSRVMSSSLMVKSPGIPATSPLVTEVMAAGIPVIDEIEFAFRYISGRVIAITGTNGKTTTTLLTHHLMKASGFDAVLAGNIGVSLARQVAVNPREWYVVEVSSFQLEGIETFRPHIGILLNITPDHLDRYDYSIDRYADAKFNLIRNMTKEDYFIYYADDPIIAAKLSGHRVAAQTIKISLHEKTAVHFDGTAMNFTLRDQFTVSSRDTTLVGPHNTINMMAASSAVNLAGGSEAAIRGGLKDFKNAPHRLEPVGTIDGVDFINDSKATNVDAVAYALNSFDAPLIWIAGGVDKGNDYDQIQKVVAEKVKALICLGKENEKLRKAFDGVVATIDETQDISELIAKARALAVPGDVVLLSPACASFDLFKNYEDRGNQFRKAVAALKEQVEHGGK